MPFGLKNGGSTYKKWVHIVVEGQIGHNVEAYIDDFIVKSKFKGGLIADLEETFNNLHKNKMMLNPDKCSFGVSSGKLLGYLVSHRGIEANPKKVRTIDDMRSPCNKNEVQKLAGMMAALSRFVSKSGERGMLFYKLLKKHDGFLWNEQAKEVFQAFKQYLKQLPILVPPKDGETMLFYVAATPTFVSTVVVVERQVEKSAKQHPVYFVSEVLHDARSKYPNIQKLIYAVLMSSRKLKHYFLSHKIKWFLHIHSVPLFIIEMPLVESLNGQSS